jgi:hypothetical protein
MVGMFKNAISFNQDIGIWNVRSVLYMGAMFRDAESFCQDLSSWKLNKSLNMKIMFTGAKSYQKIYDIKNLQKKYELVSLDPEEKKIINKIQKLFISRDYNQINTGIELLRSLNNPVLYEFFLHGNKIEEDGYFSTSKLFSGTKPAKPYLDYALLLLINYAPEKINIHKTINRANIKSLSLIVAFPEFINAQMPDGSWGFISEDCGKYSTDNIPQLDFENLEEITITNYTELKNLDFLSKCKNLKKLSLNSCNSLNNLDVLKNLNKQINLNIENCKNLEI